MLNSVSNGYKEKKLVKDQCETKCMCARRISQQSLDLFQCPAHIEGKFHPVVLDTGANCTIISADILNKIHPNWLKKANILEKRQSAKIADSSSINILAVIILRLRLGNIEKPIPFNVIENGNDVLVGANAMREFETNLNINIIQNLLIFNDNLCGL